jgi:Bifunctional DNA primase/polymerase, N-terminal/Primase C terminal 1 (PriCT-1)
MNLTLKTALALAKKGKQVFPCRPREKEPATAHGCKDATSDPDIIQGWWREWPDANLAVATGAVSNVLVLDIDGLDAEAQLRRLEANHGPLPATVESITARGRHLFFQYPEQPVRNSAGKLAPGIDVRGEGGYVLVPPSIHPSGRRYCWSVDSGKAIAPAPEWLLAKFAIAAASNGNPAVAPADWRNLVCGGVDKGQRNESIARLAGYLLRRRVDPVVALEMLIVWNVAHCRPPLEATEINNIVDSIAARELKRRGAS